MNDDATNLANATTSAELTNEQLAAVITSGLRSLDRAQLALLNRYMTAMQRPISSRRLQTSDIADPLFVSAVGHYLALHHATQSTRLNKKGFEFLFQYACDASGKKAIINPNATDAGADVLVNQIRFSLKTQADKAVKRQSLYIQKLMEARWIRELAGPRELHDAGLRHIQNHLQRYDRILVFKAYPRVAAAITYELVEIPKTLFHLLSRLTVNDFPEKNKYGTCSVSVPDDLGEAFRLVFDGSVEKIRIFNLRARNCISHAEWTVHAPVDKDE